MDIKTKFEIYYKLASLNEYQFKGFVDKLIANVKTKTDWNQIKIIELGSGFGIFSLPVIQELYRNNISFEWSAYEKNAESIKIYRDTLKKWNGTNKNIINILKEIAIIDYSTEEPELETYHTFPGSTSKIIVRLHDVQKIAYIENEIENYDILYAPFFFNHIIGWPETWKYFYEKLKPGGFIVLGKVGGDWWATEGVFEKLRPETCQTIEIWRSIWKKLKKMGIPNLYREISALNIQPIVDYISGDGGKFIADYKLEKHININRDNLKILILEGIFSPFKIILEFENDKSKLSNVIDESLISDNSYSFNLQQWFELYEKSRDKNISKQCSLKQDMKFLNSFSIQRIALNNNYELELDFWIQKFIEGLLNFNLLPKDFNYGSFNYSSPQFGLIRKDFFSWQYYYKVNQDEHKKTLSKIELYTNYLKINLKDFSFTNFLFKVLLKKSNLQPIFIFNFVENCEENKKIEFKEIDSNEAKNTHDSRIAIYLFTVPQSKTISFDGRLPVSKIKNYYNSSPLILDKIIDETILSNLCTEFQDKIDTLEIDEKSWNNIKILSGNEKNSIKKNIEKVINALAFFFGTKITIALPITSYIDDQFVGISLLWLHFNESKAIDSLLKGDLTYLTLPYLQNFTNMVFSQELNELKRKHALRSAVAAIMARNMSHNIGSHVLNSLSDSDFDSKFSQTLADILKADLYEYFKMEYVNEKKNSLISKFLEYLRERMDFVAAIPTYDPLWKLDITVSDVTKKLNTKEILIRNEENVELEFPIKISDLFLLVNNIVNAEGITYKNLEIKQNGSLEGCISIYGGVLGVQAFYVILENYIRNSAKHGSKKSLSTIKNSKNKLEIRIDFISSWKDDDSEFQEDFIKVELYDNLGGWPKQDEINMDFRKKVDDEIGPKLDPSSDEGSLIDDKGKLNEGNWGLKEMRIAASYLRGIKIEHIDDVPNGEPLVIKAFQMKSNADFKTLDGNESLGYRFFLKKPKNVLIISECADIKGICFPYIEYKNNGIDIVGFEEFRENIFRFTHEFFVLDLRDEENRGLRLYEQKNMYFPMKTLFLCPSNRKDFFLNPLKELFRKYDVTSRFFIDFEQISDYTFLKEILNSNYGEKVSVKKLCKKLTNSEKFKMNIKAKWNKVFSKDNCKYNVDLYIDENRIPCLSGGNYNLSILHPPLENFKGENDKILSSDYFYFFSRGIKNIFEGFYTAFDNLSNADITKEDISSILKAFEISSYNFVVIDERIFDYQGKIRDLVKGKFQLGKFWYFQNVIYLNLEIKDDKIFISYFPFESDKKWETWISNIPIECISQKNSEIKWEKVFPYEFKQRVHFLIVHMGIIDKMGGKVEFETWLETLPLEFKPWFIIIVSGRGHPENEKMPANARFLDFSNLRKYVVEEPDKYILSNAVLNVRE